MYVYIAMLAANLCIQLSTVCNHVTFSNTANLQIYVYTFAMQAPFKIKFEHVEAMLHHLGHEQRTTWFKQFIFSPSGITNRLNMFL